MNQKSVVKNYLYNLSYQILIIILPLVTASYLARVLGAVRKWNLYLYLYNSKLLCAIWFSWNINVWAKRNSILPK